ncbi:MAG: ComEA family DNA-binding protein [Thermodesulfobacteriota bacterium]
MMQRRIVTSICCALLSACLLLASPLQAQDTKPVNINTAPVEVLVELDNIGETLAQRIVDYRQEKPFESIQEITEVSGIGEATFQSIKDDITVE